jgi:hypothetical protein
VLLLHFEEIESGCGGPDPHYIRGDPHLLVIH